MNATNDRLFLWKRFIARFPSGGKYHNTVPTCWLAHVEGDIRQITSPPRLASPIARLVSPSCWLGHSNAFWWKQYFGCTNNPSTAPHADPDGDKRDNYSEFFAGTNSATTTSAFRILSAVLEGNGNGPAEAGRTNALQSATSVNGNWSNINPLIVLTEWWCHDKLFGHWAATNSPSLYFRVRLIP